MKIVSGSALAALLTTLFMQACSPAHFIGGQVNSELLRQPGLGSAQVGVSVYDPAAGRYLYDYQGEKYFVPASNTKLFTLYAGLNYLGDSLGGLRYRETDTALFLKATGDPTLLHAEYPDQPVIRMLQGTKKKIWLIDDNWADQALGKGWVWDDYNDAFMAERSSLPVFGNTIRWVQELQKPGKEDSLFDPSPSIYSLPEVDWPVHFTTDTGRKSFFVRREKEENIFRITEGKEKYKTQDVPFITHGVGSAVLLLKDTIGKTVFVKEREAVFANDREPRSTKEGTVAAGYSVLRSRPVDSLFRPMMFNSDNFFAEQTLLMVSNEHLGKMKEEEMIAELLGADLHELPQKPVWADGSGLSRYNLFTPQDFVWLLDKMSRDFSLARMERLLPTGGSGTLANYYKRDSGYIFAKTGSLSGVAALSGYLVTKKNRLLIFSILVNNYTVGGAAVRKQVEKLVHAIREKY